MSCHEEIWWRTVSESLENKKFHFHNCFQSLLIIILLKYCCIVLDNSRLSWPSTHGDTWISGTRSCQGGDSAGTPRHMLPWNYKSKHQFGTFLITTKKLKMYFFSYPVPKWPKCNYSTIIQLCFVLFWFIWSQNPKIYRPTWLGFVPIPQTWLSGNISHKVSCDLVSPWKFLFHDSNTFLSKIGWIHLIVSFQNKSVSHYDSHMGTPTEEVIGHARWSVTQTLRNG